MLFNSATYLLLFLPVVLLVFVRLSRSGNTEAQITWLIAASLFFYGSWNPIYIGLILMSVIVNFLIGRKLASCTTARQRYWLAAGVGFNLGLLGYFKYAGFFIANLNALGNWLIPVPEITLPLAISFFTFQQIAYLVDVRRGDCREYQFRHYSLFVLFFPQLIAGPIVHHREMMPQFESLRPRRELWPDLAVGMTIIAIGLFKKVVLADSLAGYADPVFAAAAQGKAVSFVDSWVAIFAFSLQIYFDFSGYSDMAIGSARLFGIKLPENFCSPYKAASIIDFWRRWHITLSRFLRDYLYISLGGNRDGRGKRYRNLLVTMLLGGLWHGAAWTFVVWGALHGLFLCINHAWRALVRGLKLRLSYVWLRPMSIALTFISAALAFAVFRAPDLQDAWAVIAPGFTFTADQPPLLLRGVVVESSLGQFLGAAGVSQGSYTAVYFVLLTAGSICWALPNTQDFMRNFDPVIRSVAALKNGINFPAWRPGVSFAFAIATILCCGLLGLSSVTEFIYFQF